MAAILLALLLQVVLFSDVWRSLIVIWLDSGDYGHGLLVLPVCLYLIWLRREELVNMTPHTSVVGVVLLFFTCAIWLVGNVIGVQIVEQASIVLILFFMVWAMLGRRISRILFFPILYLIFAVPVWNVFSKLLQDFTAIYVTEILLMIGVPALLEGHYISIPEGLFLVDDNCGGLRYFVAALALGSLYAYLNYRGIIKRVVFIGIVVILSVVVNWLRAFIVILMGHKTAMQHPFVEDHIGLGWTIFSVMIVLLFWVGARYRDDIVTDDGSTVPLDMNSGSSSETNVGNLKYFTYAVILVALTIFPASAWLLGARTASLSDINFTFSQVLDGGWKKTEDFSGEWNPVFVGASTTKYYRYENEDGEGVMFYMAGYRSQGDDGELIGAHNRIYDRDQWRKIEERDRKIVLGDADFIPIKEIKLIKGLETRIIWYWYSVAGHMVANPVSAKALELVNFFEPYPASIVLALSASDKIDGGAAEQLLLEFVDIAGREIQTTVMSASES